MASLMITYNYNQNITSWIVVDLKKSLSVTNKLSRHSGSIFKFPTQLITFKLKRTLVKKEV